MNAKEPERILGWAVDKNLADFEPLISNLRQEGSSRADLVQYLVERIKLVESRLAESQKEVERLQGEMNWRVT